LYHILKFFDRANNFLSILIFLKTNNIQKFHMPINSFTRLHESKYFENFKEYKNVYILYIHCKFHVFTVICSRVTPKIKIDFVKNRFWVNIFVFVCLARCFSKLLVFLNFKLPNARITFLFLIGKDTPKLKIKALFRQLIIQTHKKNHTLV